MTFALVAFTVLISGLVASVSTWRITSQHSQGVELRTTQTAEDLIEERMALAGAAVDRERSRPASGSIEAMRGDMERFFRDNHSWLNAVVLVDSAGSILEGLPDQGAWRWRPGEPVPGYSRAIAGQGGFVATADTDGGRWELWLTRRIVTRAGETLVLAVRLDSRFLRLSAEQAASLATRHTVFISDGERVVAAAGPNQDVDLRDAEISNPLAASGVLNVRSNSGVELVGVFNDIQSGENLKLRAVVLRPVSSNVASTVRTVLPVILVLIACGVIGVLAARAITGRVVEPLRELEQAAKTAAAGSYVRPLVSERSDELGSLAEAFNAVSLRLNALHDLSQLLASASRLDQVLDGILSSMGHIVGPGGSAVYLLEGGRLVPARSKGLDLAGLLSIGMNEGCWLCDVLSGTDPVVYPGPALQLAKDVPALEGRTGALLAAPLVAGHEPLGLVIVVRTAEEPPSEAEREMLRTFSAQAAVAVQTSRLFEVESRSRRIAEALRNVAVELVKPDRLESALGTVERIVAELFSARDVVIGVVDRPALGLSERPSRVEEPTLLAAALRAFERLSSVEAVLVGRGADAETDRVLDRFSAESMLAVPVSLGTDHGAVLVLLLVEETVSTADTEAAEAVGDEIALALDNAYFYQRALAHTTQLETIFRISQAIGSSLQTNVVLNRVLDVVQKILSADAVVLFLYDNRTRRLTSSMGRGDVPPKVLYAETAAGEDIPGAVFERRQPVVLPEILPGADGMARNAYEHGLNSLIAVPLLARGRSIGVLAVFAKQAKEFSDEDLGLLQTFASQASLAIDTARLYGQEHQVASVLQRSILPDELPQYPEFAAGSVYAPAGAEAEIGGDYYDVFRGPDDCIWFAIGDVCGKGVEAATKTSMIKYSTRALATAGCAPSDLLFALNNMIAEHEDPSDIVTLWVGRFDSNTQTLSWSSGGHPAGLLVRNRILERQLLATGPLLGAVEGAPFGESEAELMVGDRIILYTDGVSEARHGNIFFGEDRILEAATSAESPELSAQAVLSAVREYVDGELRDDVAVLVVELMQAVEEECADAKEKRT